MRIEWKKLIGTVAPTIATALGGPLAGVATRAVSEMVLGKPDGKEDEIEAALATGNPELLVKLKEAEANFKAQMKKLELDIEQVHATDRASARAREIAVGDKTSRNMAYASMGGFFLVLFAQFYFAYHNIKIDVEVQRTLDISLGVLFAMVMASKDYFLGSSAGSAKKSEAIDKMMNR